MLEVDARVTKIKKEREKLRQTLTFLAVSRNNGVLICGLLNGVLSQRDKKSFDSQRVVLRSDAGPGIDSTARCAPARTGVARYQGSAPEGFTDAWISWR